MEIAEVQIGDPSREAIREISEQHRRPVLFRGAFSRWKPRTVWSPAYLKRLAGERRIRACENDDLGTWYEHVAGRSGTRWMETTLAELLDVLAGDNPQRWYAGEISIDALPELRPDLGSLAFLPDGDIITRFWLGKNNLTQLHYDVFHTLLFPIWGHKEVLLYAPSELDDFYPSTVPGMRTSSRVRNPHAYDRSAFPNFERARGTTVRVTAEDLLFIPIFWWHFISGSREMNFSVTFHFGEQTREVWSSPYFRHYLEGEI